MRAAGWSYADTLDPRDLQLLTHHELLPETQRLIESVVRDAESPYEVMRALEGWLSGSDFRYTLDLPPLPAQNGVDYFLTRTRQGHCELFASALALMARSRGIPARVVSGYRGGDFSEPDRAYSVRASMAHLWVEAYFAGVGWVRFDPSPQASLDTSRLGTMRAAFSRQLLRGKMFWYQSVMGFQGGWRLDRLFGRGGREGGVSSFSGFANTGAEALRQLPRGAGAIIPVSIAAVLLAALLRLFRGRPQKRRGIPLTSDQKRAARLYRALVRRLERLGIPCAGQVAEEVAGAVGRCGWVDRNTAFRIIDAYNAVRFGGRPMSRGDYAALCRALSGLRTGR